MSTDRTAAIWNAVDSLTKPHRQKLHRDNGATEWVTLPSLYDQLADAVQSGAGGVGHGKQESRPPLDVACMSLLIDIAETVNDALRSYEIRRQFDTPKDVRRLTSHLLTVMDDDLVSWWTDRINRWAGQIRAQVSVDPDRPWEITVACPECAATTVPWTNEDGQKVRKSSIIIWWRGGYVRAIECRMCGLVVFRGPDLDALIEKVWQLRNTVTEVSA